MSWLKFGYVVGAVGSVTVHVFAFGGLSVLKPKPPEAQRVAVMVSQPKKAKPKKAEPPKPIEAPKELLQRPLAPARPAPPPPAAAPPPALRYPKPWPIRKRPSARRQNGQRWPTIVRKRS